MVLADLHPVQQQHGDIQAIAARQERIGVDEDMAGAAVFLASRAGDYVVGSTVTVDGGVAFGRAGFEGESWKE